MKEAGEMGVARRKGEGGGERRGEGRGWVRGGRRGKGEEEEGVGEFDTS